MRLGQAPTSHCARAQTSHYLLVSGRQREEGEEEGSGWDVERGGDGEGVCSGEQLPLKGEWGGAEVGERGWRESGEEWEGGEERGGEMKEERAHVRVFLLS